MNPVLRYPCCATIQNVGINTVGCSSMSPDFQNNALGFWGSSAITPAPAYSCLFCLSCPFKAQVASLSLASPSQYPGEQYPLFADLFSHLCHHLRAAYSRNPITVLRNVLRYTQPKGQVTHA